MSRLAPAALLLCFALSGCVTSRRDYREASRARTLADVNAVLVGRRADVLFADGSEARNVVDARLDSNWIAWRTTFRAQRRPLANVTRVTVRTRGANRRGGALLGTFLGFAVGAVGSEGRDESLKSGLRLMFIAVPVGAASGLALSAWRSGRQRPLVAYEGPPSR